ncbi:MAG: hypothetical protein HN443_04360 [Flavobacteriaceae bacterium]|jgi:hypothetical protein|nr:hypothetical protein [Flavobacteriaceae bacterium]
MKNLLIFLLLSVGLNAQFNYQAIVKHSSGGVISNNQVKIKFSLMYQSSNATPTFIEEHEITVPDDGVVNLSVGGGTVLVGTFSDLDWSKSIFIKEELDTGSGYQNMGTRKIASVPLAEYSKATNISSQTFVTGDSNIQIGTTIGQTNGGHNNIAIGKNSLLNANGTSRNISIGENSMKDNAGGVTNVSIGSLSLSNNTSGNSNVSIGYANSIFNKTGSGNVNIGEYSGYNNESGSRNVNIGYRANYQNQGSSSVNHSSITTLGANTLISGPSISNSTAIGTDAIVTSSNTIQLGNTDVTLVNTSGDVSANDYLINGGESLVDIVSQLPSSDDYAALTMEVAEIDIQTDSLSSTQSDIASLIASIEALNVAQSALLASVDELIQSNKSEIKSAQVGVNSNDVVLFELGVLRFSWNNTYNTIQVKQSSSSEIVDNWYISGIINSGTETYIQKSNMTYGLGDDGSYNDRFTPIWSNGFTSLMDGSIALGSAYSNFEFYITPMGSGSTPYDPVPTWQLRGHVDGYNQLTVTCVHVKFDGTSGW